VQGLPRRPAADQVAHSAEGGQLRRLPDADVHRVQAALARYEEALGLGHKATHVQMCGVFFSSFSYALYLLFIAYFVEFGPSVVSLFLFFLKQQQAKEQQQRVNAKSHFLLVVDKIADPVRGVDATSFLADVVRFCCCFLFCCFFIAAVVVVGVVVALVVVVAIAVVVLVSFWSNFHANVLLCAHS
jgi:hypothetical protein